MPRSDPETIGKIAAKFMQFRDQVKVFHWQSESFSQHKASDQLVAVLSDKMDLLVETMQGSRGVRLRLPQTQLQLRNLTDDTVVQEIHTFRDWLVGRLPLYLRKQETDLLNMRDEILGHVNQILYLLTFN